MALGDCMQQAGNKFIVCAFYTDKYREEVENLKASLEDLNIEHYIKSYESRGYWEANTRIKPEFLLECMNKFNNKAVVYIDADAIVRKPLDLFNVISEDIGVYCSSVTDNFSHKYLTGTIFLNNNLKVKKFLMDWIKFQDGVVIRVDQDSFEQAIKVNNEVTIHCLPQSYVKIFDKGNADPVVEHFQASRKHVKLQRLFKKIRNGMLITCFLATLVWLYYRLLYK
jgi:hypothetical protein